MSRVMRGPAEIEAALAVGPDVDARTSVEDRAGQVIRPAGAFRRLDEVAAWLAGWQRRSTPTVDRSACLIFAADHGVAARGVSAYPPEVTVAMVGAIEAGIATCTAMADRFGVDLALVDVGVGRPTNDLTVVDALTAADWDEAWDAGRRAVVDLVDRTGGPPDVLIVGELGIGNTTAAAAVSAALLGGGPEVWCGRGTGVDDDGLDRKRLAVATALDRLGGPGQGLADPSPAEPLEILRRVGGRELVAMAAATVEARTRSIPMLLDGFIATAGVLPLHAVDPAALDHCLAGHVSAEPGHRRQLDHLGLDPLLQLDLRLGEGSGALVAVPVIQAAVAAVLDVATFAEASVSGPVAEPAD